MSEVVCVGGVDKVEGVHCTSEQVDLLVWVPHNQSGAVLMEKYIEHCGIHVLALIYQLFGTFSRPAKLAKVDPAPWSACTA